MFTREQADSIVSSINKIADAYVALCRHKMSDKAAGQQTSAPSKPSSVSKASSLPLSVGSAYELAVEYVTALHREDPNSRPRIHKRDIQHYVKSKGAPRIKDRAVWNRVRQQLSDNGIVRSIGEPREGKLTFGKALTSEAA